MEYLTDEDYKIAAANGIKYQTTYSRMYEYGWSKQDAITKPVYKRSEGLWPKYRELCGKTGITQSTFHHRVRAGMTPEQAATTPPIPAEERYKLAKPKKTRLNQELIEIAAKNGIGYKALAARVYVRQWEIERAITEPLDLSKRKKGTK